MAGHGGGHRGTTFNYHNLLPHSNKLQQFVKFYDDFDTSSLAAQLTILHGAVTNRFQNQKQSDVEQITVLEVANLLKNTYGAQQLLDQVWRLTKLLLVVPATSATAERSFSALRRVKTYLRATIGETRLNSALVIRCHQDRADSLNIVDITRDFVCATDSRANAFGTFLCLIRVIILNIFLKLIIICILRVTKRTKCPCRTWNQRRF